MRSKKILLIENRGHALAEMIRNIGYTTEEMIVWQSISGHKKKGPDVEAIVVNVSLGQASRSSLLQLRERFREAPVILIADRGEAALAAEIVAAGADDYLLEGHFDEGILKNCIEQSVERKKRAVDYKLLVDESPVPMYIFDSEDFRILAVNEAAVQQYGYSYEEFMVLSAIDIRPPEDVEAFYRTAKAARDAYTNAGRWRHRRKSGDIFYVEIFSRNVLFEGRQAKMILAMNIDEAVRAEDLLIGKIKEVGNILESITDGFYALNRRWEFTYVNKEFERVLGVKREEILGRNAWEVFPEATKLRLYPEFHRVMQEKVSVHFEDYYPPRQVWALINAYPAEDGIVVYFVDLTEQKKIQERLYEEQQHLRAIINNTDDIIWLIDRNLNIIAANDAFWKRLGQITGKSGNLSEKDFDPVIFKQWRNLFERAFKGEHFTTVWEDTYNGEKTYAEISFNPIYDKQGNVSGASCFSRDITSASNYQHKIEYQNERLRKIAWLQSHKVRVHVANIMGLASLFNHQHPTDPQNAEVVQHLEKSAGLLDDVIREISRLTTNLDNDADTASEPT